MISLICVFQTTSWQEYTTGQYQSSQFLIKSLATSVCNHTIFYAHIRKTSRSQRRNGKAGDEGHCPSLDTIHHIKGSEGCKDILVLTDFNSRKQKHENLLSTILVNRTQSEQKWLQVPKTLRPPFKFWSASPKGGMQDHMQSIYVSLHLPLLFRATYAFLHLQTGVEERWKQSSKQKKIFLLRASMLCCDCIFCSLLNMQVIKSSFSFVQSKKRDFAFQSENGADAMLRNQRTIAV